MVLIFEIFDALLQTGQLFCQYYYLELTLKVHCDKMMINGPWRGVSQPLFFRVNSNLYALLLL